MVSSTRGDDPTGSVIAQRLRATAGKLLERRAQVVGGDGARRAGDVEAVGFHAFGPPVVGPAEQLRLHLHAERGCLFPKDVEHSLAEVAGQNVVALRRHGDAYRPRAASHVEHGVAGFQPGVGDEVAGVRGGRHGCLVVGLRALVPVAGVVGGSPCLLQLDPFGVPVPGGEFRFEAHDILSPSKESILCWKNFGVRIPTVIRSSPCKSSCYTTRPIPSAR